MVATERDFNIVLWGCTGSTGKMVALLLARRFGLSNSTVRIALAGRSEERLRQVGELMLDECLKSNQLEMRQGAQEIQNACDAKGGDTSNIPLIVLPGYGTDSKLTYQMARDMAIRTDVVIALAGPFQKHGEPILKACAETGTDYVDITGECLWVKEMYTRYGPMAEAQNARIIPCCGLGYILNDIGVAALHRSANLLGAPLVPHVEQQIEIHGSRPSRGTLATLLLSLKDLPISTILFGSSPDAIYEMCQSPPVSSDVTVLAHHDSLCNMWFSRLSNSWILPTFLGRGMIRYVHWTNELKGHTYGNDFIYDVGSKGSGFISALFKTIVGYITLIVLVLASRYNRLGEIIIERLAHVTVLEAPKFSSAEEKKSDPANTSVSLLHDYEKPGCGVEVRTIGLTRQTPGSSAQKIEHTIVFKKGEGYLLSAYTAIEVALCCLKKRQENNTDGYGIGSASSILGIAIEEQLRVSGFQMQIRLCPFS